MENIYEQFGKLMVQKELVDNQLNEIRKLIQADINKIKEKSKEVKKEGEK